MFDLEQAISEWRKQMLAVGIQSPALLDELEIHLREEIERQVRLGANEKLAFETAETQMGRPKPLKMEFEKIGPGHWWRPLGWAAWITFALSFFLPVYPDCAGWRCAVLSATAVFSPEFWQGNWFTIHLALLTLANLFMVVSPFWLLYGSHYPLFMQWFRWLNFLALVLVWSFLSLFFAHAVGGDLKVGCFVWATSFLLLCLSTLRISNHKTLKATLN